MFNNMFNERKSFMNFDAAWDKIVPMIPQIAHETNAATINIYFAGGSASLHAPRFFKEVDSTRCTVKRAWDTYCRGHEEVRDAITDISITPTVTASSVGPQRIIA